MRLVSWCLEEQGEERKLKDYSLKVAPELAQAVGSGLGWELAPRPQFACWPSSLLPFWMVGDRVRALKASLGVQWLRFRVHVMCKGTG